jgi:hypothetical protein
MSEAGRGIKYRGQTKKSGGQSPGDFAFGQNEQSEFTFTPAKLSLQGSIVMN